MVRVVMFDLGLTLIDGHHKPFAKVPEALTAIAGLKTSNGTPVKMCLVSDFTMAEPPGVTAKIRALFKEYLAVLDETGLRPFFEPVQRRVTLSTQAGALKPDRKVFETALRRLQVKASLTECLLVTEDAAHVLAVRNELHMQTLRFRAAGSNQFISTIGSSRRP